MRSNWDRAVVFLIVMAMVFAWKEIVIWIYS